MPRGVGGGKMALRGGAVEASNGGSMYLIPTVLATSVRVITNEAERSLTPAGARSVEVSSY